MNSSVTASQPAAAKVRAAVVLVPVFVLGGAVAGFVGCAGSGSGPEIHVSRPPALCPDYRGVVIPPNIAPLNFRIEEEGVEYRTRISGARGTPIELRRRSGAARIPIGPWRALLRANAGESLSIEIAARTRAGGWRIFEPVTNRIARESIDGHLVYRRLHPAHSLYETLGIYQRDLESYRERPLLENSSIGHGCINCHTFNGNRPELMALNIRLAGTGNPILLLRSNQVSQIAKTAGYLAWHPSGRLLAYSSNRFRLFFHTQGETRDVFDFDSDLGIYRLDDNSLSVPPALARPDRQENWPSWSPDGRFLYYCSAPKLRLERFEQVRYDLMRVAYDLETDRWGEPEMLLSARELRLSVNEPRVSPDGRWLLCCLIPYGNFPPYHPTADLYLLDLETRRLRRLEINSDQCDSYPAWSSNGRWIVFSSKRRDGLFAHPYFSHVDPEGRFAKPVLLPQRNPAFYDSCIQTYNRPELVTGPVPVVPRDLIRALYRPRTLLRPEQGGVPLVPDDASDQPFERPDKARQPTGRPRT